MLSNLTHFFTGGVPMQIREGNLHVGPGPLGQTFVVSISAARAGYRRLGAALAMFDAKADNVIPACAMCERGKPGH